MKKIASLVFILFLPLVSLASEYCEKVLNSIQPFGPTKEERSKTIHVWRHQGQDNFQSAQHTQIDINEDSIATKSVEGSIDSSHQYKRKANYIQDLGYTPIGKSNPVATEVSEKFTDNFLDMNQEYSLGIMQETGYLAEADKKIQMLISQGLSPDQVTFIGVNEVWDGAELYKKNDGMPDYAFRDSGEKDWETFFGSYYNPEDHDGDGKLIEVVEEEGAEKYSGETFHLKTGNVWLISGQVMSKETPLALENESLDKPIDRKKMPFIWEIGRAAQTSGGAFLEAASLAVLIASLEAIILNGSLENAYVFGHSLDRTHSVLYKRYYGMKHYSYYNGNSNEEVLYAPLESLLEKSIENINWKIFSEIMNKSSGKISLQDLLKIKTHFLKFEKGELIVEGLSKIAFRNLAPWQRSSLVSQFTKQNDRGSAFVQQITSLLGLSINHLNWNDLMPAVLSGGTYGDIVHVNKTPVTSYQVDYEKLVQFLSRNRAIELDLRGQEDKLTKDSLEELLSSVSKSFEPLGLSDDASIAITFRYLTEDFLSELPVADEWHAFKPAKYTIDSIRFQRSRRMIEKEYRLYSVVFKIEDIKKMTSYSKAPSATFSKESLLTNIMELLD